jgi:hypothetical protein
MAFLIFYIASVVLCLLCVGLMVYARVVDKEPFDASDFVAPLILTFIPIVNLIVFFVTLGEAL